MTLDSVILHKIIGCYIKCTRVLQSCKRPVPTTIYIQQFVFDKCLIIKVQSSPSTVRWKMYYQKYIKQGCYMVNFTKFMIHMHLCIKNKINLWALFWLDQNYRFFYSKLTVFWSHFSLPKNDQFCIWIINLVKLTM